VVCDQKQRDSAVFCENLTVEHCNSIERIRTLGGTMGYSDGRKSSSLKTPPEVFGNISEKEVNKRIGA